MLPERRRELAEREEDLRPPGRTIGAVELAAERFELLAEARVVADQRGEFRVEAGVEPVKRRELHLLLEIEMRFERPAEAAHGARHLPRVAALERAQRRALERVEVLVLRRDAAGFVREPQAQAGLIVVGHMARDSTMRTRCAVLRDHPPGGTPMDLASCDALLTTTRSVRRRLDFSRPVERAVVERCIEIALQAPTGSNAQGWHFVVVTDAAKKRAIRDHYRTAFQAYLSNPQFRASFDAGDRRAAQQPKVESSATHLAEHLHEAPLLVIPCIEGRVENAGVLAQASIYGSILPAAWSFMLALRARGLGTAWTTLHLIYEKQIAELLGIPDSITQTALLPVAYTKGTEFQVAKRLPASRVTHWDAW